MTQPPQDDPDDLPASAYPQPFLRAVAVALARLGWHLERWLDGGLECRAADGTKSTYGLDNVFRKARTADEADWPELIAEHLERVEAGMRQAKDQGNLGALAGRILARVGKPFDNEQARRMVWWRRLGNTGVILMLVVDHPQTMAYVTKKMIEESGRTGEEWLEVALDNLRERTSPEMLQALDEETGISLCLTNDAYDAARALVLERLLPEDAEHGWLVAVPNRDRLFVLPVCPESLVRLHLLQFIARQSFQDAPYPISDEVIWVRGEDWLLIPIDFAGGKLTVNVPEEFAEVLRQIVPPDEED
jgi:uncharacterized protein YtpQ (UPF0354 family)